MNMKINRLKEHPLNIRIYGNENIDNDLVESIKNNGILVPLTIKKDGTIISGHRRFKACKKMSMKDIPVNIIEFKDDLEEKETLINFNQQREKTYSQMNAEADELEIIEREKAKRRQATSKGGNIVKSSDKNNNADKIPQLPQTFAEAEEKQQDNIKKSDNETMEIVAKKTGFGSKENLRKYKKIKEKSDAGDEKAKEAIEKLDKKEITINKVYNDIKKAEKKKEREESLKETAKLPESKFQVLYCDPPWQYNNSGLNGSANSKYNTMSIEELCNMPIKENTEENAVCFMWCTNPLLENGLKLLKAWGFEYKTNMVWIKEKSNYGKLGFYVFGQHELLLIGVKGSVLPIGEKPKSVIQGENKIHSKKPEIVYEIIESMYPNLKYLELFARNEERKNWIKWGNEVGKYEKRKKL